MRNCAFSVDYIASGIAKCYHHLRDVRDSRQTFFGSNHYTLVAGCNMELRKRL